MKQTAAGAAVSTVELPSMLRAQASDRPNIVLFLADDMTWRDCGVYGSDVIQTPNMGRLAGEGKRFDGCFTSTSVCAPTRQQLYTGMFPVRNGAYPQAGFVHDGVRSLPHHFKDLGYRVGLVGKTHFGPAESFPFELLRPTKTRELLDSEKYLSVIKGFINQESEQPYCLVITSHNPHLPYTHGPQDLYDPDKLKIPPYLIDTPETRKRLANYYAEITALDAELGRCMKIVDESAGADNTLMAFTTEQGSAFPYGGKWTCYENGLHTGLIMRWPGKIAAGSSSDALVQYVDIVPTHNQPRMQPIFITRPLPAIRKRRPLLRSKSHQGIVRPCRFIHNLHTPTQLGIQCSNLSIIIRQPFSRLRCIDQIRWNLELIRVV
jgi:uncharacterized sulfatase